MYVLLSCCTPRSILILFVDCVQSGSFLDSYDSGGENSGGVPGFMRHTYSSSNKDNSTAAAVARSRSAPHGRPELLYRAPAPVAGPLSPIAPVPSQQQQQQQQQQQSVARPRGTPRFALDFAQIRAAQLEQQQQQQQQLYGTPPPLMQSNTSYGHDASGDGESSHRVSRLRQAVDTAEIALAHQDPVCFSLRQIGEADRFF